MGDQLDSSSTPGGAHLINMDIVAGLPMRSFSLNGVYGIAAVKS